MRKAHVTLHGVLPPTRQAERHRAELHRMSPVELDLATIVAAVKRITADIRRGRLGH